MWQSLTKHWIIRTGFPSRARRDFVCKYSVSDTRVNRRVHGRGPLWRSTTRSLQRPLGWSRKDEAHYRQDRFQIECSYTAENDSKSFGSNKVDDRVLGAVESLGGRVTVADVASQVGIDLPIAQRCLVALANVVGGHLEVSRDGEIVYVFPSNVRRVLLQESVFFAMRDRWKKFAPVLNYLLRISFGIMLVASIFIIYTSIMVISSSMQSRDEDRRGGYNRSYHGGSLYLWMGPSPFDLVFYSDQRYGARKRKGDMSFLESIFSFLFGDGNPNAEVDTHRWQKIGEIIRRCGGAVIAEQIAPFLNPPQPRKFDETNVVDESFMLPVLEKFGGRPEVTDDGDIVYVFPDLLNTASTGGSVVGSNTDSSASTDLGYIEEKEYVFSKASSGQILGAAGLGVLNLLGAVTLGEYMAQLRTVPLPFLKWLYPPLLGYALAFIIIPVVRWYRQRQQNALIAKRNQARLEWYQLLRSRNPAVMRKLEKARRLRSKLKQIDAEDIAYTTAKSLIEQNQELFDDFDKKLR